MMRTVHIFLLAASAATSAHAAPALNENTVSAEINIRGLQLTSEADVRRLHQRVSRAAKAVCAIPGSRGVADRAAFNACRAAAMRDAQRQIETAIAAARNRGNARLAAVK